MTEAMKLAPGVLITEAAYDAVHEFLSACRDHGNLRPHGCDNLPSDLIEALESNPPGLAGDRGNGLKLAAALRLAEHGANKAGCDGWRAQEMCRQIVPLLQALLPPQGSGESGE